MQPEAARAVLPALGWTASRRLGGIAWSLICLQKTGKYAWRQTEYLHSIAVTDDSWRILNGRPRALPGRRWPHGDDISVPSSPSRYCALAEPALHQAKNYLQESSANRRALANA